MVTAASSRDGIIRFGTFELDVGSGELRRDGVRVPLQQQPLTILLRLLDVPGEVVTREALQRDLWPESTFGDFEHGLNAGIKRLRDALDDSADTPRFIETLPRRGYRFIAPVVGTGMTTSGPAAAGRRWGRALVCVASALAVGGLVIAAWAQRRTAQPQTGHDLTILVADFTNRTGDAVFDDTLAQAVRSEIEQSPSFRVISRERVRQTLSEMTRSPDDRVTGDVALEVCERVAAHVVLRGSITALGRRYAVALEATDCDARSPAIEQQAEAADREHVLETLGGITVAVRRRLGESAATLRGFSIPISEATTASLEALKAFSVAEQIRNSRGDTAAEPYYQRAIALDRDFALAYVRLATVYSNTRRVDESNRMIAEAAARRGRISEVERFWVENLTCISRLLTNPDACTDVSESWKRLYPQEPAPYMNLCMRYNVAGQYDRALPNGLEAVRLAPERAIAYTNLLTTLLALDRIDEAKRMTDTALERHIEALRIHESRYLIAVMTGDRRAMAAERAAARGAPDEYLLAALEAEVAESEGRLKDAHEMRIATATLAGGRLTRWVDGLGSSADMADAAVGRRPCRSAPGEFALLPGVRNEARASRIVTTRLLCGDDNAAERLLIGYPETAPLVPAARALIAAHRGDHATVAHLLPPSPADFGSLGGLRSLYLRGLTYLRAGDGRAAAAEFQRIIDHRGIAITSVLHPLAHVQQARGYRLSGDLENARRSYERFFNMWERADPDVPILVAAQQEYRRLAANAR